MREGRGRSGPGRCEEAPSLLSRSCTTPRPFPACCAANPCLQEEAALMPSEVRALHHHLNVLGVIGIVHCSRVPDLHKAYRQFQQRCKCVATLIFLFLWA